MAYINKVAIKNEWQKLETLLKEDDPTFAFASGNKYQIQCEGDFGARLCLAADVPADEKDGETIIGTQTAIYGPEDGNDLYVRCHSVMIDGVVPYIKVSQIGE